MIQSPCIAKCGLNDDDMCMGCYRNLDEIVAWSRADDVFKTNVWQLIPQRKHALGYGENKHIISRKKWLIVSDKIDQNLNQHVKETK
ncbi:DUF1289 domain-containing protein [Shewanella sp. VB17]|uniref:DUF1289 domain-containing protein n=1 Tax=Shewanella sp. VB17 TaxID=2739432 RepID=UPI00156376D7|nr:DUF1289 domain-containing protein [Shewanella sp. VB17]NRD74760.1 DUF1289 domain-containing protein [Shewanella sp. VB17]